MTGICEVSLVDDVVAIEDAARRVSQKHHGDAFRHTRADEVPGGGPAAVVQAATGNTSFPTRLRPGLLPVAFGHAVLPEDKFVSLLPDRCAAIEHALERW